MEQLALLIGTREEGWYGLLILKKGGKKMPPSNTIQIKPQKDN